MNASEAQWIHDVLPHQGVYLDPQHGCDDPQTPDVNRFSVAAPCYQVDEQLRSVPRNMDSLEPEGWLSPASTEVFEMNAPFLTGSQSPVSPDFAQGINANATAQIATPPTSIIAPDSIHSSPQGLPVKPDVVPHGSLAQSSYLLQQQQQQQQPADFGHPANCACGRCLSGNHLLPSGPDDTLYNVHYRVFAYQQQQQQQQVLPLQPWVYHAAATLPSQAPTSFAPVTSFPNMDGLQAGGPLGDMTFDNDNLSLSSSDAGVSQDFVVPDSPESFILPSQRDMLEMKPEMQQLDGDEPQAAQRKKLPDGPSRAQTPDDVSEESSTTTTTEDDGSSEAGGVPDNDFLPSRDTTQRKTTAKVEKREERSLSPLSAILESSESQAAAADIPMPDASGIDLDRQARDRFIVACRERGMTYREIKKAGRMHEAESTLRGRHRVLTKSKAQRIRKPQWTEKDIELLRTTVQARTWRKKNGRKTHVIWSQVAADMIKKGSSYQFGAMTCSNKWSEITDNPFRLHQ